MFFIVKLIHCFQFFHEFLIGSINWLDVFLICPETILQYQLYIYILLVKFIEGGYWIPGKATESSLC